MPRIGATVSVVRVSANPQDVLRALETNCSHDLHVLTHRVDNDPVALMLEIYTRQHQKPHPSQSVQPAPRFVFSCARKTSWAALKQLRADVLDAVATVETAAALHRRLCEQCQRIAAYMVRCFEQPAVFNRTWNGSMVLNTKRTAHVINTLVRLAGDSSTHSERRDNTTSVEWSKAVGNADNACCARAVVAVLAAFFVPDLAKSKTE